MGHRACRQRLGDGWAGNHHRYLSGLLLAIGLGLWSTVSGIKGMTARFRLLTALVVVGGLARLLGLLLGDTATPLVVAALVMELLMELLATPLLCLCQSQLSHATPALALR